MGKLTRVNTGKRHAILRVVSSSWKKRKKQANRWKQKMEAWRDKNGTLISGSSASRWGESNPKVPPTTTLLVVPTGGSVFGFNVVRAFWPCLG